MSDKEKRIGFELRELKIIMNRYTDGRKSALGYDDISFAQGGIVHYLHRNTDHPVYQREIEKAFNLRRSTVTGLLQGLEKNGYIERISVPDDGRLKQIVMTDKALNMEKDMQRMFDAGEEVFFRGFREEEKKQLFAALERIKENIREEEKKL